MPVALIPEEDLISVVGPDVVDDGCFGLSVVGLAGNAPGMVSEVYLALSIPPRVVEA